MAYVIVKHPVVRMDLMVLEEFWPKVVSIMERTGVTYEKEERVTPENGTETYVVIRDLKGHAPIGGNNLGEFLGLFYGLEWGEVTGGDQSKPKKFYILMSPRKRGKDNDHKDRTENHSGSEGGNPGESEG